MSSDLGCASVGLMMLMPATLAARSHACPANAIRCLTTEASRDDFTRSAHSVYQAR